jgi:N-ethylmaleimide reductase
MKQILTSYDKQGFQLKNRLVMAPMTRSRAIGNIPNDLMVEYYSQRTGAGLIITEGTAPTPEGSGYPRIPGIYNNEQIAGWKKITDAVHKDGSKIFLQLMHTGRIGHKANLQEGLKVVGASGIKAAGQIFTDAYGMQDHDAPVPLTTAGVKEVIHGFVTAARNAVAAGFDGVEVHGANGYLVEQFLNPHVNNRPDEYGGSIQARAAFTLEVVKGIADAIGKEKTAIRFSPFSTLGDIPEYDKQEVHETYTYLAKQLDAIGICYVHIGLTPAIQAETLQAIRTAFGGTFIICNGFTPETAEDALQQGKADLVAFGSSFLANPDLDRRIAENAALNTPDFSTAYTPGASGYTDYPTLAVSKYA